MQQLNEIIVEGNNAFFIECFMSTFLRYSQFLYILIIDLKFLFAVDFLELDLASFTSVLRFVQAFESKELPLHLLINNGKSQDTGLLYTER